MALTGVGYPAGVAAQVMSAPVVTVAPQDTIADVADTLRQHAISAAPVVDESGAVLGLVSEYDLLAKSGTQAQQVMTTDVITVAATTPVSEVRHLLVDRRIGRTPVLAQGRLVGIVSRGDVVALLATEWVCGQCGEPARGERPPQRCPRCGQVEDRFSLQEQLPGS